MQNTPNKTINPKWKKKTQNPAEINDPGSCYEPGPMTQAPRAAARPRGDLSVPVRAGTGTGIGPE
jgi:hypothetical protein